MQRSRVGATIPWTYTDRPGLLQWTWVTEHLAARIHGSAIDVDGTRVIRSYGWELCDRVSTHQDMPRLLVEGQASSFEEAERRIREHVGKAYDPRLGYLDVAGAEATTFTLASGERIDAAPLVGTRCTVTLRVPDGTRATVSGDLSIRHYSWILRAGAQAREITPEHVESITHRSAAAARAEVLLGGDGHTGIGRIYRAEWVPGCTGAPGFDVGVVDHGQAPACPVHERARQGLPA